MESVKTRRLPLAELERLKPLFPAGPEEHWQKYLALRREQMENETGQCYTLEWDGEVVGELWANLVSRDLPEEAIPGRRAYLNAFRLRPDFQGRGLGQKLMEDTLAGLEAQGYAEFTIGVEEDNGVARHIYQKLGFTQAIAEGKGDELDPSDYTLYLRPAK